MVSGKKETLNKSINNIGLMIKDKKNKKNKINKLVETIDILPSLVERFNLDKKKEIKKILKDIDGTNTIFSGKNKKHQISESIYMSKYYTVVRKNNMSLAMEYDLNHKTISKLRNYKFYNKNENLVEINKINKLLKKEFLKIGTSHVQKNKLIKNP